MNFKEFLEMDGTPVNPNPNLAQQNTITPDVVQNWEVDSFLSRLGAAYASRNSQQFQILFHRAAETGRYVNNARGRIDFQNWWIKVLDAIATASPNMARTDHTVQKIQRAIRAKDYDVLYNIDQEDMDNSGETKLQTLGGAARDADAILQFSSKAQQSDL